MVVGRKFTNNRSSPSHPAAPREGQPCGRSGPGRGSSRPARQRRTSLPAGPAPARPAPGAELRSRPRPARRRPVSRSAGTPTGRPVRSWANSGSRSACSTRASSCARVGAVRASASSASPCSSCTRTARISCASGADIPRRAAATSAAASGVRASSRPGARSVTEAPASRSTDRRALRWWLTPVASRSRPPCPEDVGRTQEQPRQLDTGFSLRCIPLYEGSPGVSERPGPALSRDADHIHRRAGAAEASTAWRSTGPGRWIGAPVVPPVGFEPTLSGV